MKKQIFALSFVGIIGLTACNTTSAVKKEYVFLRSDLNATTFQSDVSSCETYVKENGHEDGNKAGATAIGFLIGGLGGAASMSEAYERSITQVYGECMYGKGYRQVSIPYVKKERNTEEKSFNATCNTDPCMTDETISFDDKFNQKAETLKLIQQNKAKDILAWHDAVNSDVPRKEMQAYLSAYPQGYFANEAKAMLDQK